MPKIILVSGACGSGKTTFADALARHLVRRDRKTLYVIHGDSFHRGFAEPEDKGDFFQDGQASDRVLWEDILRFNWDCITATAQRALQDNLDVVIDYVVEDELPRVSALAEKNNAPLYYIVLTAGEDELRKRLLSRGDADLTGRAKEVRVQVNGTGDVDLTRLQYETLDKKVNGVGSVKTAKQSRL